jgi:hypothetical protein
MIMKYEYAETLLRELAAPRRNQFFYGKRMDVQHFRMEQDYGRLKQAMINRLMLGKGVVCGLRVAIEDGRLTVGPGVAIDGLGREIVVPVRSVIDRARGDAMCCGGADSLEADARGVFTLWLCYRECSADYQPVLVSDCGTREQCAAGTTVESFCFKVTAGLAPLQGDPRWCVKLPPGSDSPGEAPGPDADLDRLVAEAEAQGQEDAGKIREALSSRRRALCNATSSACAADEKDPCVPLAAVLVGDGRPIAIDECLVRPRVYSNAVLLDLILCLAERIDECCKDVEPADLLRIASIEFLRRDGPARETVVARVASPSRPTEVPIGGNTNAIRIRFTKPYARNDHAPTTPTLGDQQFDRHNVLVTPEEPLDQLRYVPGTLAFEAPDVVRFDLFPDSPYSRGALGWQKGRYRLRVCGTDDVPSRRRALTDIAGVALDGEPRAPAAGAISGDGTAAGDFSTTFVVG